MAQVWICPVCKKIVRVEDGWVLISKDAQGNEVRAHAVCVETQSVDS